MTAELILGIVLVTALVILILLAARQEKLEATAMEEIHQKTKAGTLTTEIPEVVVAAEKVMEEAVAPAPVEVTVVETLVEAEAVVEAPKEEVAEVKPKKKRKYKKKNPQTNK